MCVRVANYEELVAADLSAPNSYGGQLHPPIALWPGESNEHISFGSTVGVLFIACVLFIARQCLPGVFLHIEIKIFNFFDKTLKYSLFCTHLSILMQFL